MIKAHYFTIKFGKAKPSRRLLHLFGTVCRRQYIHRRHYQFSAEDWRLNFLSGLTAVLPHERLTVLTTMWPHITVTCPCSPKTMPRHHHHHHHLPSQRRKWGQVHSTSQYVLTINEYREQHSDKPVNISQLSIRYWSWSEVTHVSVARTRSDVFKPRHQAGRHKAHHSSRRLCSCDETWRCTLRWTWLELTRSCHKTQNVQTLSWICERASGWIQSSSCASMCI